MVAKIPLTMLTKNSYRFGALETNPKFKTSCRYWLQKQFKQKMWRICMLLLTTASWHGDCF